MDADVIVIGAGAAGMAAARSLAARSLRVVVVEARDRVGGRAHSVPAAREAIPAELGAEFIHGRAPSTMALLREVGTAAIDTGGDSWSFVDGELRQREDDFSGEIFERLSPDAEDETVDRFLARFEGDPKLREQARFARLFAEGFEAADPAIASVRSIADESRSGVDSRSGRPIGGYVRLVEYMRDALDAAGVSLRLSTVVRRIAWRDGAVDVTVNAGAGAVARTLHARAAIVTLPIGVLRVVGDDAVTFEPALPAAKRDALAKIEMGHVVRVVLSFRSAFWEELDGGRFFGAGFFRAADVPGGFAVYWTQVPVRTELVSAWLGGPKALELGRLPRDEIVERALEGFGRLFGDPARARAEFAGAWMHDWANDPFSRGAYSYVAVGGDGARAALGDPVSETLFFAGEATSTDGNGGTVNGALESGERAAREAAAALTAATAR